MTDDQPARSRADLVAPALERERRRQAAQQDVDILKQSDNDEDLAGLADSLPVGSRRLTDPDSRDRSAGFRQTCGSGDGRSGTWCRSQEEALTAAIRSAFDLD